MFCLVLLGSVLFSSFLSVSVCVWQLFCCYHKLIALALLLVMYVLADSHAHTHTHKPHTDFVLFDGGLRI